MSNHLFRGWTNVPFISVWGGQCLFNIALPQTQNTPKQIIILCLHCVSDSEFESDHVLFNLVSTLNTHTHLVIWWHLTTQRIPMNHDQCGLSQTPPEHFMPHQTQAEKYHSLWTNRESEEAGLLGDNWLIRTEQTPQHEPYRTQIAQRIRLLSLPKICWNHYKYIAQSE